MSFTPPRLRVLQEQINRHEEGPVWGLMLELDRTGRDILHAETDGQRESLTGHLMDLSSVVNRIWNA